LSRRRRWILGGSVAVALLVALVAVGRHERSADFRAQNRGIERVRAAVGPLDSPSLYGYRILPAFDCLVYRRAQNPLALELCADGAGRVVEAVDRRAGHRLYYSLHGDAGAAQVVLRPGEIRRLLKRMGAI
jgi:hypothetical protein